MFFTREDILKIQQALLQLGVKDSELPSAEPVTYDDTLSIVQDGKNKQIKIEDFFNQISLWKREDFINITDKYDEHYISLIEAINLVPVLQRKDGLVITFQDIEGNWEIYQFRGNITEFFNIEKWFNLYDYRNNIIQSIVPDEEDLTASISDKNGNSLVSLKDRVYDSTSFSGKGYKILRKNIQSVNIVSTKITITKTPSTDGTLSFTINGKETQVTVSATTDNTTALVAQKVASALQESMVEYEVSIDASLITLTRKSSGLVTPSIFSTNTTGVVCTITDSTERKFRNILIPDMINQPNTIYEIRYDFDLNNEIINIQEGCILYFKGGSFSNGTLKGNNTITKSFTTCYYNMNFSGSFDGIIDSYWHIPKYAIYKTTTNIDDAYDSHDYIMQAISQASLTINKCIIFNEGHLYIKKSLNLREKYNNVYFWFEGKPISEWHFKVGLEYCIKGCFRKFTKIHQYAGNLMKIGGFDQELFPNRHTACFYDSAFKANESYVAIDYCSFGAVGTIFKNCFFSGRTVCKNLFIHGWHDYFFDNTSMVDGGISNSYIHGGFSFDADNGEERPYPARFSKFANNSKIIMSDFINNWIEFADMIMQNMRDFHDNRMINCMLDYVYNLGSCLDLLTGCKINHYLATDIHNHILKYNYAYKVADDIDKIVIFSGCTQIIGNAFPTLYFDPHTYLFGHLYKPGIKKLDGVTFNCGIGEGRYLNNGTTNINTFNQLMLVNDNEQLVQGSNNIILPIKLNILPDINASWLGVSFYDKKYGRKITCRNISYLNTISSKSYNAAFFTQENELVGFKEYITLYIDHNGIVNLTTPIEQGTYGCYIEYWKNNIDNNINPNNLDVRILNEENAIEAHINNFSCNKLNNSYNKILVFGVSETLQVKVHILKYTGDIEDKINVQSPRIFKGYIYKGTFKNRPTGHLLPIGQSYYCTDKKTAESTSKGMMIYYKGNEVWIDSNGVVVDDNYPILTKGTTNKRPTLTSSDDGFEYYDTTLKKKILWNGTAWVNLDGTELA